MARRAPARALLVALSLSSLGRATPAGFHVGSVQRWTTRSGARVVTSARPDAATVAACFAGSEDAASHALRVAVARRGGDVTGTIDDGLAVTCVSAPSREAPFIVELALGLAGSPGAPLEDTLQRLALEGVAGTAATQEATQEARAPVIVVTGAFAADALAGLTAVRGPTSPPRPIAIRQSSERLSVVESDGDAPRVAWGWFIPPTGPEESAALAVSAEVLAGQARSRLPRLLVTERGLARRATGSLELVPGGTLASVSVECTTRTSIDRVRRFVDGALKTLRLVGPTRGEVARARARLWRVALEGWEDPRRRALRLLAYELHGGDAAHLVAEAAALASVTPEHVRRAFAERFVDARRSTVERYPARWPADDPRLARHQLHTAEPGETLEDVARRHHLPVKELARANDLDPARALSPGQPIWIPPR